MDLTLLLEMVVDGMPDRVLIGDRATGVTAADLASRSRAGAAVIAAASPETLVYLAGNGPAFPVSLFAAAYAGVPFLPVNYRLSDEQLGEILGRHPRALVITDSPERIGGLPTLTVDEFLARTASPADTDASAPADPDSVAVLLMTSGTTAAPKSAVLRHRHLTSYILSTVEFMGCEANEATVLSVPPYHIAAIANLLSNLYAGRRIYYLDTFTAADWIEEVTTQQVTHAMVVPTMLVRIVEQLRDSGTPAPGSLRSLSYGGAKIATPVLIEALRRFPDTGFVNAYGLTETASSIAVLGPDDHRAAIASDDDLVRARLSSVGRPLPSVEIEVRDDDGTACPPGMVGDILVRGPQVAGEYLEAGSRLTDDGWFPTRDVGYLDADGFLFVQGRSDDTIIRGGENIAPSEIEAVLAEHPAVADCAVAGIPDDEWGQRIAAFVVLGPGTAPDAGELTEFVRARLRSAKTPDQLVFLTDLPVTPTGKVLRRSLVELAAGSAEPAAL